MAEYIFERDIVGDNVKYAEKITNSKLPREEAEISILDEASDLVGNHRSAHYGPPQINHERIAQLWSVLFDTPITARQVALAMVMVKLSREIHAPKRDNLVDGAAYLHIADICS